MKKTVLYLILLFSFSFTARAQFLDAVGAAAGVTYGKHLWSPEAFSTQERYLLGFNGAGLVEFLTGKTFRWRVELEYNQMGSKELIFSMYKNRTTYITLNNYLKIQTRLWKIMPYILIGPRVEYLLQNSPQVYGNVIGAFPKFWFTGAVGIGFEWINRGLFRPFIEGFYNRDILPSYSKDAILPYYYSDPKTNTSVFTYYTTKTTINYQGFEARIGFRYLFDKDPKKAKCPKVINPMGN